MLMCVCVCVCVCVFVHTVCIYLFLQNLVLHCWKSKKWKKKKRTECYYYSFFFLSRFLSAKWCFGYFQLNPERLSMQTVASVKCIFSPEDLSGLLVILLIILINSCFFPFLFFLIWYKKVSSFFFFIFFIYLNSVGYFSLLFIRAVEDEVEKVRWHLLFASFFGWTRKHMAKH